MNLPTQAETQLLTETGVIHAKDAHGQTAELRDELMHLVRDDLNEAEHKLLELRFRGHNTVQTARTLGLHPDVLRVRLGGLRKKLRNTRKLIEWF